MSLRLFAVLIFTLFVASAFAHPAQLDCELALQKEKSSHDFVTSKIKTMRAKWDKDQPGVLILASDIKYAKDTNSEKGIYVYLSLNAFTGDLKAQIRGSTQSATYHKLGGGMPSFQGTLANTAQPFQLSIPLNGKIDEGYLEDREDKSLTEFDSVSVKCIYAPFDNER